MPEVKATVIGRIEGIDLTPDGKTAVFKTVNEDGVEEYFATADTNLLRLVIGAAKAHTESRKAQNAPDNQREGFTTTWWELGGDGSDEAAILSLTFEMGAQLSFRLPAPMPRAILETLQVRLGGATIQKPETPLN